ncbi:MAG: TRAP transporter small permease [Pseudomonadota bacterium]
MIDAPNAHPQPVEPRGRSNLVRAIMALDRVLAVVNRIYLRLAQAILIALVGLVFAQVVGRYTLGRSILGLNELTGFLLVWLVFLMAFVLHRRRRHIVITAVTDLLGRNARQRAALLTSLGVIAFAVYVCIQLIDVMPYLRLTSPVFRLPDWSEKIAPAAAFVPMLLQELVNLTVNRSRAPGSVASGI